jgi:antitoxin MazE
MEQTKPKKIMKWGVGLGVLLPAEFIKANDLKDKEYIEWRTKGDELILKPLRQEPTLEELVAMCPDWDGNPPEKFDWGEPMGREVI